MNTRNIRSNMVGVGTAIIGIAVGVFTHNLLGGIILGFGLALVILPAVYALDEFTEAIRIIKK